MTKKISYKGIIPIGEQDRIRLKTMKGKVGYRITQFKVITSAPGTSNQELIAKITKTDQTGSITTTIDFSDNELLGVVFFADRTTNEGFSETIIFDNEKFNQDIFINITDVTGNTNPANYYIELEEMPLSDLEATMLTLKSIKTIKS
jgi:hypothetical protein